MDDRVVAAVSAWVHHGRFLPGSRLPSLRTICALVGCTRHAAQQAVLALERDGVLVRRSPRVFTVAGRAPAPGELDRTLIVFANVRSMRPHPGAPEEVRYTGGTPSTMAGIEAAAARYGLAVSVFPPDPATLGRFSHFERLRPLGWIFLNDVFDSDSGQALLRAAQASSRPAAVWGDSLLPAELDGLPCDAVLADHRASAALLVRRLAELGARRLLPVVLPHCREREQRAFRAVWMHDRLQGYADGAAAAGITLLPPQPYIAARYTVRRDEFEEGCMALAGVLAPHLADDPPADALLAPEDGTATALACAARRLGRVLPVAGYDATWPDREEAAWGPPPEVSIDQQWAAVGASLVDLVRWRAGASPAPPVRLRVPGALITGGGSRTYEMSDLQCLMVQKLIEKHTDRRGS